MIFKVKRIPQAGDKRVIRKFLWWPTKITMKSHEISFWCWLRTIEVYQKYSISYMGESFWMDERRTIPDSWRNKLSLKLGLPRAILKE